MQTVLRCIILDVELLNPPGSSLQSDDTQCQPGPHGHTLGRLLLHLGVHLVQLDQLQQVPLQFLHNYREFILRRFTLLKDKILREKYLYESKNSVTFSSSSFTLLRPSNFTSGWISSY